MTAVNIDARLEHADWPKRTPDKFADLIPTLKYDPNQPRGKGGRWVQSAMITVGDRQIEVVKPRRAIVAGDKLVPLNVIAFDQEFQRQPGFYIGVGGKDGIGNRYARFGEYVAQHDSIEAAEVTVHEDGRIGFTNGRHRYAWLRDQGLTSIPVAMTPESVKHAKQHGYLSAVKLAWDESKHPRDKEGQFTHGAQATQLDPGAGGGGGVSVPSPAAKGRPSADPEAHDVAQAYNAQHGLPPIQHGYVTVDEARAGRIADAYEALPVDDSDNPVVQEAYAAFEQEINAQWDFIVASGMTFEPWTGEGQPYANSQAMVEDVKTNKHMYFFVGGNPHPLGKARDANGLTLTDKFRAVHDYFGHAAGGYGFGPRGEENAWLSHSQMLSPQARRAMTPLTRGQNSWVNFGRHNYHADGTYKNIPVVDRPFAPQKAALLPDYYVVMPGEKVLKWDEAKHPRNPKGSAAGGEFKSKGGIPMQKNPSPEAFIAARNKSKRRGYLSPLDPADLKGYKLYLSEDGTIGGALSPDGDMGNLFNNGGPKGAAHEILLQMMADGGKHADAFDGYLPKLYANFGLQETGRMKFNPEYAPPGWNFAEDDSPDVIFLALTGAVGTADDIRQRTHGDKSNWITPQKTTNYYDDYDAAKRDALTRAESSGVRPFTPLREDGGRGVDRETGSLGAEGSESLRRRLEYPKAAWDESQHPRDAEGQFTEEGEELPTKSSKDLKGQREALAKVVQKVYDDWDEDPDCYAGGGICHLIAEEIAGHLAGQGIDATTVSAEIGEQHVWTVAKLTDGVYEIDVPPSTYETGAGYRWKKVKDIEFTKEDIVINRLDADPKAFKDYVEKWDESKHPRDKGGKFVLSMAVRQTLDDFGFPGSAWSVNRALREGRTDAPIERMVSTLDALMRPEPAEDLHRVVDAGLVGGLKVGDTYEEKGYTSTSRRPDDLSQFDEGGRFHTEGARQRIVVRVPKDYPRLDTDRYAPGPFLMGPAEGEVILPRGTKFQVVATKPTLIVTVVPTQKWDESQHPRDKEGKFTESGLIDRVESVGVKLAGMFSGAPKAPVVVSVPSGMPQDIVHFFGAYRPFVKDGKPDLGGLIYVNPKMADPQWVKAQVQSKHQLQLVSESIEATVAHEYGHHLTNQLILLHPKAAQEMVDYASAPIETKGWFRKKTRERWQTDDLDGKSKYATTTVQEWLAEAFTDGYLNGDKASESGKFIYGVMQRAFGTAKKADPATGRYVTPFVSFEKQGDESLRMIASLNSSRLATWGFTAEAEVRGMARYKLTAVLDGRTSDFCRIVDGKIFHVEDARRKVIEVLNVQNPEDLKVVQPWPKQTKAALQEFQKMTPQQLTDRGLHIPPYHPHCRTICRVIGSSKDEEMEEVATIPDDTEVFQAVTQADLREIGVDATPEEVAEWNAHVGMSPVELMSKLTGMPPQEVMTKGVGSTPVQFEESGNIAFHARGEIESGVAFKLGAILDPFTGIYYLTQADLLAGTPAAEVKFLKNMFSALIEMGIKSTATSVAVGVAGNAAYYAKLGFLPDELEWDVLRSYAWTELETGALKPLLASLKAEDQLLVRHLLQDQSVSALSALVDLPFTYQGRTIGEWILAETAGTWGLDLLDEVLVAQARAYLS